MSPIETLRGRAPEMVAALQRLVEAESPTDDPGAAAACADVARALAKEIIGDEGERIDVDGRTHLRWRFGSRTKALLLGHLDTVWALGTLDAWPFAVAGDRATGPGCFDMKAGVVQLLFALSALDDLDGVGIVLTTDEELGSPTSRPLIAETAAGVNAVLVLEPSAAGSLKTQRKGVSAYRVDVVGRAAHAGLEPEKGVNAAIELAHQIIAIAELARPADGTTVTPSVVSAGTTSNTVPGRARLAVDVRTSTIAEQGRVESAMRSLAPVLEGASISVEKVASTTPLERTSSAELYDLAQEVAADIGLGPLTERAVGGGSDGNFTAGLGIPTLDGLGAVGDGAHAEGEWVSVAAMPERAALLAGLVARLTS